MTVKCLEEVNGTVLLGSTVRGCVSLFNGNCCHYDFVMAVVYHDSSCCGKLQSELNLWWQIWRVCVIVVVVVFLAFLQDCYSFNAFPFLPLFSLWSQVLGSTTWRCWEMFPNYIWFPVFSAVCDILQIRSSCAEIDGWCLCRVNVSYKETA